VRQIQQVSDSLYILNSFAQKYFSNALFNSDEGQDSGLSYLKERGFREEVIEKFQLGYCLQSRDAFATAALAAQYNPDILQKSGLVVMRDEKLVDNYRGRIIFPVHNHSGKILGFGARIIGRNDKAPKYINTPENEIYIKSKILYGSYFARQAIDKNDECLLVEGYTDVISLHQAGIENVVASGGTSLTQDQLRLVKKYTNNLTIIYDGDSAGVKAALRGLDMALEEGLNVKLVLIPDKEDPDSYVHKLGAGKFQEFIKANKKDFILFQLEVSLQDAGSDTSKKAEVVNQIAETISRLNKVEDFTKQRDYIRRSAEMLKIEETGLNALVNKFIRQRISKQELKLPFDEAKYYEEQTQQGGYEDDTMVLLQKDELQERALVRCLIEFGLKKWDERTQVAEYIFEEYPEVIEDTKLLRIVEIYKTWYEENLEPTDKNFLYHEDQQLSRDVVSLLDFPYEVSQNWKEHFEGKIFTREELYLEEVRSTMNYLKLRKIKKLIEENQRDLERLHTSEEQLVLIQTHQHLKQMEIDLTKQMGTVILR
jgi:DNA primase